MYASGSAIETRLSLRLVPFPTHEMHKEIKKEKKKLINCFGFWSGPRRSLSSQKIIMKPSFRALGISAVWSVPKVNQAPD